MKRTTTLFLTAAAALFLAACSTDKILAPAPSVNLGTCTNLQAPANTTLASRVFATGVQVYRWDGNAWTLITPSAVLTADSAGTSTVGIHYAGPTWEVIGGGKVVGAAVANCTPNANAIPWLLLSATSTGAGAFQQSTFIQRVNTTGGKAPAVTPGTAVGAVVSVPYTAEYFFYRPE